MSTILYPVRCKLVEGDPHDGPPRPEDNNPHVGEFGVAVMEDGKVTIHLDSGIEIPDGQCWWVEAPPAPLDEGPDGDDA